ncbi:MAG TPA: shikimate dehydrogenase [Rickettsiales bacterium]|nr:shikimate dehydrogenase [Rickettsiales bacterium]
MKKIEEKLREIGANNPNKKICIIIGNPVEHSLSPAMHNASYKSIGLNDQFIFDRVNVTEDELKYFIEVVKKFNSIVGITCTMPHKQSIIQYLDELKDEARIINAVNTVLIQNGKYVGYNTDWYGIERPFIERKINLKNKKVAIIGAGGASKAAIYTFKKNNCIVNILNRTKEKADLLAEEFNCNSFSLNDKEIIKNSDVIINTTNVGMGDMSDLLPIDVNLINKNQIIFDCIYKPKETKLIQSAKIVGTEVIYGWEMLLYQGIMQFEIYTDHKADIESMRSVL